MDIIIVGSGRVGRTIADHLNAEGHSITVIDESVHALEKLEDTQNIMTIEGNGATLSTLKEANVSGCDLLIAVTATDELNLYTCLIAKNAGVKRTIARVRNPLYTVDLPFVKDDLKLSLAINPELLCARELTRMIKFPGVESICSRPYRPYQNQGRRKLSARKQKDCSMFEHSERRHPFLYC